MNGAFETLSLDPPVIISRVFGKRNRSAGRARSTPPDRHRRHLASPSPCHERRVQDITDVLKDAFGTLSVLIAPFRTRPVS